MKSFLPKYFFIIITLMLAFQLNSQMVYPDTIKTSDRIRLLNHNTIDEYFFIYNSYMSSAASATEKLHTRMGLKYIAQVPTCSAGGLTNTASTSCISPTTNSDIINEFTDNLKCSGGASLIEISVPLKIENSASSHRYFVQILLANCNNSNITLGNIQVSNAAGGTAFGTTIANGSPTVNSYSFSLITIRLSTVAGQTDRVNVEFMQNGTTALAASVGYIDTTLNLFRLRITSDNLMSINQVSLSIYSPSGTNRTTTGIANCSISNNCIENYFCSGTVCNECKENCLTCSGPGSNQCTTCNRHTREWKNASAAGQVCTMEYTDITKFQNIITKFTAPKTNRLTLGFWAYAQMDFATSCISVVIDNYFITSFSFDYASASRDLKSYTVILENNLSTFLGINNWATLASEATKPTRQSIFGTISGVERRWVYIRSGMSYDHKRFYQSLKYADNANTIVKQYLEQTLENQTVMLSPAVLRTTEPFKYFYRLANFGNLRILNASTIQNTQQFLYIKNLYIFREYLPENFEHQYFDLHKFIVPQDYPELLFALPFDDFNFQIPYSVPIYDFDYLTLTKSTLLLTSSLGSPTFRAPENFVRLDLLSLNGTSLQKYTNTSLVATTNMTNGGNTLYSYEDNVGFACNNNFLLNYLEGSPNTCVNQCLNSYMMHAGTFYNQKGRCNYKCTTGMTCNTNVAQLTTLSSA